jgi:hypothetical protein
VISSGWLDRRPQLARWFAIPPPVLSGSGSRVEGSCALLSAWVARLPVQIRAWGDFPRSGDYIVSITNAAGVVKLAHAPLPLFLELQLARADS